MYEASKSIALNGILDDAWRTRVYLIVMNKELANNMLPFQITELAEEIVESECKDEDSA